MALFTIADLHLSLETNKPMDVFGGIWKGYIDKLLTNWNQTVGKEDLVVIPGDISWATYLDESLLDFLFLEKLNGKKIILKGNHDYWFETVNKLNLFFEKHQIKTISMLHNSFVPYEDIAICGTKGSEISKKPISDEAKKIESRETQRLFHSVEKAREAGFSKIYVFIHYPPLLKEGKYNNNPIFNALKELKVEKCFYGHLHTRSHHQAVCGVVDGIDFQLVSGDYLDFTPLKVN